MKAKRKIKLRIGDSPEFRRVTTLSVLCALGLLLGHFTARHVSSESTLQLKEYLSAYMRLRAPAADGMIFLRAFAVYFRYVLCIFLLHFTAAGIYLIPLSFVVQGFSLAFAVTSFFRCVPASPLATLSLFALRAIIVLPTSLYFGSAAMQMAFEKESRTSAGIWRRFGICICALLLGVVLETTVVPRLFALALQVSF